mmetsp:Transcript_22174/g.18995  ORF Transcript_22174/g.18995 Transcript_22174/m.18995 type:complete len:115 (-) Transcript_22174:1893-2237(-)
MSDFLNTFKRRDDDDDDDSNQDSPRNEPQSTFAKDWINYDTSEDDEPAPKNKYDPKQNDEIPEDAKIYEEKRQKKGQQNNNNKKEKKGKYLYRGEEDVYQSDEEKDHKGKKGYY